MCWKGMWGGGGLIDQRSYPHWAEAEFLEVIRTKVLRVFFLASSLRTFKILHRNLNEILRSWIRLLELTDIWIYFYIEDSQHARPPILTETTLDQQPNRGWSVARRAGHRSSYLLSTMLVPLFIFMATILPNTTQPLILKLLFRNTPPPQPRRKNEWCLSKMYAYTP